MTDTCIQNVVAPVETKAVLDICQQASAGDEDARRKLIEMLFDRIHRTASYLGTTMNEAEDIAQTACVEVLLSAGSFRGESSLQHWADRVTFFTAMKMQQKKTRRQRLWDSFFMPETPPDGLDDQTDQSEVRLRLAAVLRKMKYSHREILLLRYLQGYTTAEAADICNIPLETARGRLKKGRALLKKKVMSDTLLREWILEWEQS